jgi:hypothetical protein
MRPGGCTWLVPIALAGALAGCSGIVGGGGQGSTTPSGAGGGAGAGGGSGLVSGDCTKLPPVPRRLWRLSPQQYGKAVKDLLGLATAPTLSNNGGTSEYAFFSDDAAGIDANLQYSIYQATDAVMTQITPRLPQLAACTTGEAETACAQRFAQSFGARAFRRPLETTEVTALLAAYTEGRKQDFNAGISLMIQALLQSPSFLFRTELGPAQTAASAATTTLTPYEVATQLSFLFRDSIPDPALLAAAQDGSLATESGIAQQVDRLLALPEVKQNISRIVVDWFNVRQLFSKTKSDVFLAALPAADRDQPAIQNDLLTSAQRFVDDVLWSGSGALSGLLTSKRVFVNQRLATLYGFPFTGAADQFAAVEPPDGQRAGMLTQPAFIWALSDPETTSIVKRGRFVHDDIVCQDPAPSPGNLLDDPNIMAKLAMLPTEMDKSEYRMMTAQCKGCHSLIDPYARVLQNFGPAGQFRTTADGKPVDPTGDFSGPPIAAGSVTGPPAFAQTVVDKKLFGGCGVQKMASYVLGRMIRVAATCEVQEVHAKFDKTDGSVSSLFR